MQDMTRHPWHRFGFALGIEQGPPAHPLDRLEQLLPAPSQQRHLLGLRTEVIKAVRREGRTVNTAGLAPRPANWANWQTTAEGMTFHFNDYQLGDYGLRTYTVPWSRARLVLSAYGEKILLP